MINKDTYKRLTKKGGYTKDLDLKQELGYSYIYTRLSELENKIMDGTLIELPFLIKVSSKYAVIVDRDKDGRLHKTHTYNIAEAESKLKELQEKQK